MNRKRSYSSKDKNSNGFDQDEELFDRKRNDRSRNKGDRGDSSNKYEDAMNGGNNAINPWSQNTGGSNNLTMPPLPPNPPNNGGMMPSVPNMPMTSDQMIMMNAMMNPIMMQAASMMDPNMMMGAQFGMMPQQQSAATMMQGMMSSTDSTMSNFFTNSRTPMEFTGFKLLPPHPKAPIPSQRERPLGCKTIFVGGLPENTTDEMLGELFSKCGEIQSIRISAKRFAHIRFMSEMSVDLALFYSGYKMRIEKEDGVTLTGRLHIDFAQARDDQYEYECQQRALDRERRRQARLLSEQNRVPSPPPIIRYSDHEALVISEKIKCEETFEEALQIICNWLERGDCNKRNAVTFFTLLQSTNSHIRRLISEKAFIDEEFQQAKDRHAARINGLVSQYKSVEHLFTAASQKKVWDHFSKAQRKSIDSWKKNAMDMKVLIPDDSQNMETDTDDEEKTPTIKMKVEDQNALKDENDSLRCQLEAYKNEVQIIKLDMQTELDAKEKKLSVSQQTLTSMQQTLLEAKREQADTHSKMAALKQEIEVLKKNTGSSGDKSSSEDTTSDTTSDTPPPVSSNPHEAKLIGLISIFLHIHPFGATVEYIWSYVQKSEAAVKVSDVEAVMQKFPLIFSQDICGIGANIERRWKYCGLNGTADKVFIDDVMKTL